LTGKGESEHSTDGLKRKFPAVKNAMKIYRKNTLASVAAIMLVTFSHHSAVAEPKVAPTPHAAQSVLHEISQALESMPDCKIEYQKQWSSARIDCRYRYFRNGKMWRYDKYEYNKLVETFSFDGDLYYLHQPKANYLLVTKNEDHLQEPFTEFVSNNPLYLWAKPLISNEDIRALVRGDREAFRSSFGSLENLNIVENESGRYKLEFSRSNKDVGNDNVSNIRYSVEVANSDSGLAVMKFMNYYEIASTGDKYKVDCIRDGWHKMKLGNVDIQIPGVTKYLAYKANSEWNPPLDQESITLQHDEMEEIASSLNPSVFRVPATSVRHPYLLD